MLRAASELIMKWLIYTLLLVNLGLFVWHFQPNPDKHQVQQNDQLTRLVLLKEYQSQLTSAVDADGIARCFSLGPFTRKKHFNEALSKLQQQGLEVFSRVSSERVRNGYWVMLPIATTSNQAKLQIQRLKDKGLKDYFLVAAGEMKNAVSLGVFSKAKLAKRRRDQVENQGFNVKIKQITLPKRVYWLEWPRRSERQPSTEMLEKLLARFEGIGQTERRCMDNIRK